MQGISFSIYDGHKEVEDLQKVIGNAELPVSLDNVRNCEGYWSTLDISSKLALEVEDKESATMLASYNSREKILYVGQIGFPFDNGNRVVVGREPSKRTGSPLYCLEIQSNGTSKKYDTKFDVQTNISEIHFTARKLGEQMKITRLGKNPLDIHIFDMNSPAETGTTI
jgi:hypothetical protein